MGGEGEPTRGERGKSFLPSLSLQRRNAFLFRSEEREKGYKRCNQLAPPPPPPTAKLAHLQSRHSLLRSVGSITFCRKGRRRWAALTCRTDVALWRRRREKTGESFFPSYEKEKVMKRERDPTWSPRSHCPRSVLAPVELPTSANICATVSPR